MQQVLSTLFKCMWVIDGLGLLFFDDAFLEANECIFDLEVEVDFISTSRLKNYEVLCFSRSIRLNNLGVHSNLLN